MSPRPSARLVLALACVLAALSACADQPALIEDDLALIDPIRACAIPDVDAIAGHEGDFYRCVDGVAACGEDGYLLGYGARYAERFYRVTRPRMSRRGQQWIDDVLVCLQDELRSSIDVTTSCDDIREIAFDSHPRCYVDSGFCTLPFFDVFHVVTTIDLRDWFGSSAAKQAVETAAGCGREYTVLLKMFFGNLFPR